jgi:hypothetical protein
MQENVIQWLTYLVRSYDGINKMLTQLKTRIQSLHLERDPKNDDTIQALESIKGKLSRKIGKEIEYWPIWNQWMVNIPGIGPFIGGKLILLYYYRNVPVCPECGADVEKKEQTFWCPSCETSIKGQGNLHHRIEEKDFPRISSWWHYMGMHTAPHCREHGRRLVKENGGPPRYCDKCKRYLADHEIVNRKPKRQAGMASDWSNDGRKIASQFIADGFMRQKAGSGHLYRDFYDAQKEKRRRTHPDASDGHRNNMARNETAKLFLSHFWTVARTLDGKPVTEPYAGAVMGHTNIVEPFYWEPSSS